MFRLCDAFLVERLVICGDTTRPLLRKRKVVQAASGTQCWVPWSEAPAAVTVVQAAKAAGQWIAVVELTAESVTPAQMQPRFPAVLVLGNERSGVSPEVLAYADQTVAIPMLGMANSLNVATAAAIVLHELALVRELRRATDPLFRQAGMNLDGEGEVTMSDNGPERQESTAYYAGYRAFAPGMPRPECPYQDIGEQLDWERGWGNAQGYHEIHGGPQ